MVRVQDDEEQQVDDDDRRSPISRDQRPGWKVWRPSSRRFAEASAASGARLLARPSPRRPLRDGGGRDGRERHEAGLARRLQRARRGAEGGAGTLRRHGAEAVAAEVAVVAGAERAVGSLGSFYWGSEAAGAADGGALLRPLDPGEKGLSERKTCIFRQVRTGRKRPRSRCWDRVSPGHATPVESSPQG